MKSRPTTAHRPEFLGEHNVWTVWRKRLERDRGHF